MFQKKNEWSLEAYRFKSLVFIEVFFLKYYDMNMVFFLKYHNGNTRQNTKNRIKSENYPKSKN